MVVSDGVGRFRTRVKVVLEQDNGVWNNAMIFDMVLEVMLPR